MTITESGRHEILIESDISEEKKVLCLLSCFRWTSYEGFCSKSGKIQHKAKYPLQV